MQNDSDWFKDSVIYQIYPRSYYLSDRELQLKRIRKRNVFRAENYHLDQYGCGDLKGIEEKLDYLSDLGVTSIWLSPFYESPMADFGYDVSNYLEVDPLFGDMNDFESLVNRATKQDIRVIIDFVPNHTSNRHPWFLEALKSLESPYRDYYYFKEPKEGGPPNNWRSAFLNESAWSLDSSSNQYYLHLFLKEQPDLNWYNQAVVTAMLDNMKFWLDKGVSGFRLDAVHCLGKDLEFKDAPEPLSFAPRCFYNHDDSVFDILRKIRSLKEKYPQCLLLGEVFLPTIELISKYYVNGEGLDMTFMFPLVFGLNSIISWETVIKECDELILKNDFIPAWVLSNHDLPRAKSRLGSSDRLTRSIALFYFCLKGTQVIYQGDELGLEDARIDPSKKVDPGNRDGSRAPIPWRPLDQYGWGSDELWLPFPPDSDSLNVEAQQADPSSMLNLYKALISLKKNDPVLQGGKQKLEKIGSSLLAIKRELEYISYIAIINFSSESQVLPENLRNEEILLAANSKSQTTGGFLGAHDAIIIKKSSAYSNGL